MARITSKRWDKAQKAERECHDKFIKRAGVDGVKEHYEKTYAKYFAYLQMGYNHGNKTIVEIGCADFPALEHCEFGKGYLIEPLPSPILKDLVNKRDDLELIQAKAEDIDIPECDELWLLNVLQHVQDPDKFIENCKKAAKIIRFFEPIDWPIEIYHPHTFDFEYYKGHFPEAVRYFGTDKHFHTSDCAYGIWFKQ